ncbi:Hydantoinase A-domain-containing protein [Teratosphaeria destructans]|uniref:Hydantoinase A-domain-containing protein n=1 Tax=Teratosphaeria destructans TaxID=418781 RepID=A0A9W7SJT0_9PEZI|nr:Hydantoinase A-domain-containing protein [Teratosphaeria destructans]
MSSPRPFARIGVDVGGTNTDAVIIDPSRQQSENRGLLAHFKTPTTPDVTAGIETAVRTVLEKSGLPASSIASATVGTTHFINAVVEQDARRLRRVAILRLSKSFLREVPPFSEFPAGLTSIIRGYVGYVDGGLHIDGSEEAPVVESQVVERCAEIKRLGLTAVVVVGCFSPIDEVFKQEDRVRDIVLRELPDADVIVSHEVANIGLLERENASILNAAILRYAKRTVKGFRRAMKALNLTCPLFLTQNDGTLLDSESAANIPIRTFSSGATNSMRGAAYLAGLETSNANKTSAIVTGVSVRHGGGVRVNYSMPHLHSVGLGGGSIVRQENGRVTVGPDSVGHYLTRDALVFGGEVTTASDVAVAAGRLEMGDRAAVSSLAPELVAQAQDRIKKLLEGAIDVIKTSPEPLPVLLVGGGAVLAPDELEGAAELQRPPFHDVANAVGAAISKVGGVVDIIQSVADQPVLQAVEHAKQLAIQRAIDAGAIKDSILIAELESIPVTYVANQLRTIVKAVGELDITSAPSLLDDDSSQDADEMEDEAAKSFTATKVFDEPPADPSTYRPTIVKNADTGVKEWIISETDLEYLADGCYVLGCAGGGSPNASRIQLRDMVRQGYKLRCVDASALKDDAVVYWGGHMGSPATSNERLQSLETVAAFAALMEYLNHDTFDALMGLEIGGANGLEPFLVGSSRFYDRPVVDGDFMGRAYPTYWQTTIAVHAPGSLIPCAIDSGDGKTILMTRASNDEIAANPTTGDRVRRFGVLKTVSLAWRIGRCIALAGATNTLATVAESIVREVGGPTSAKILFRARSSTWSGGSSRATPTAPSPWPASRRRRRSRRACRPRRLPAVREGGTLMIPFKNENIYVEHTAEDGTKSIVASVPDLICVLDTSSGKSLGVPEFKYGFRVTVLGITCSPRWTETEAGIQIGGPKAFGYDIEYKALGEYVEPKSVIDEYGS